MSHKYKKKIMLKSETAIKKLKKAGFIARAALH
jgi:hypothetical protein